MRWGRSEDDTVGGPQRGTALSTGEDVGECEPRRTAIPLFERDLPLFERDPPVAFEDAATEPSRAVITYLVRDPPSAFDGAASMRLSHRRISAGIPRRHSRTLPPRGRRIIGEQSAAVA